MNKIDDFLNTPNSQFIDKDLDDFLRLDLIESATTNIQKNSMTFDEVMNNSDPYPSLINQEDAKTLFEILEASEEVPSAPSSKCLNTRKRHIPSLESTDSSFQVEEKVKKRKNNDQYAGDVFDDLNKLFFKEIKKPIKEKIEKAKKDQLITESWVKNLIILVHQYQSIGKPDTKSYYCY